MDRVGECNERWLVEVVRGGSSRADVLRAGLRREHESWATVRVAGGPGERAGRAPHVRFRDGEEPDGRPAISHGDAERLALPDDDVGPVTSRRQKQRESDWVRRGDRIGPGRVGRFGQRGPVLDDPLEVRLRPEHRGDLGREHPLEPSRRRRAVIQGQVAYVERARGCVGANHLAEVRMDALGDQHDAPPRRAGCQKRSFRARGRAVVHGGVRDFHPRQLTDHRLVFENSLEGTLRHLWLVRRVGGRELGPGKEGTHRGRNKVVVDPGPEEAGILIRIGVRLGPLREPARDLVLGERRIERQGALDAELGWDRRPERLDVLGADLFQHHAALRLASPDEAHACAPSAFSYASALRSDSISAGFATRIRIIHPFSYGDWLISAGFSFNSVLTATTSPDTGAKRSLTVLTASIVPKIFIWVTRAPTCGSSTNTTSPSSPCAKSVMPTSASWPLARTHSCSLVYRRSLGTFIPLSWVWVHARCPSCTWVSPSRSRAFLARGCAPRASIPFP